MSDEKRRILDLLADGKVTADEAEKLLEAIGNTDGECCSTASTDDSCCGDQPTYLCIQADSKGRGDKGDHVNIRIPLAVVRAGMKLGAVLPDNVSDRVSEALAGKGIKVDLKSIDGKEIDEVMTALKEVSIDVDDADDKVRIFCK